MQDVDKKTLRSRQAMESMGERGNLARSLDHGVLSRLAAESWRGMREASRTRVIQKKGSSMSESLPQFFLPCQKVLYESWAEGEEIRTLDRKSLHRSCGSLWDVPNDPPRLGPSPAAAGHTQRGRSLKG